MLAKIVLQAIMLKQPIPQALINAPVVHPWLHVFYNAFLDLIADRAYEDGPITWTARELWSKKYGLDRVATDLLHIHVKALDLAFLAHKRDSRARGTGDGGDGKPGGFQRPNQSPSGDS